ncbi:MAG: deoxyribonuclease IV [Parcubacteria group bacterium]|nr:deoxyribonuclease IV [Parcubacteria group bacterium]
MKPKIGAHVSASGGLYKSIENATAIGAECIQLFGASPQQWAVRIPSDEDVVMFKNIRAEWNIGPVYLHAAYLPNLATLDDGMYEKSLKNLSDHLMIAERMGADGLIFHVGSGKEAPKEEAIKKAVLGMKRILKLVPGKTKLVMENSARGGQKLGSSAHEMGLMLKGVDSSRIKICIDTAHAFEAGIVEGYTKKNVKQFCDEWDKEVGLENVVALHVNDSKTVFNSHHDRHENIGEGYIGLEGFENLAREKRLHDKAWILEVPGFDGNGPDKKNVDLLKSCFK